MKNLTLTLIFTISLFFVANCFANTGDDNTEKKNSKVSQAGNSIENKAGSKKGSKKEVKPVQVKYIWKDMPSFDKYGNEITARMRENMKNNELIQNENKKHKIE